MCKLEIKKGSHLEQKELINPTKLYWIVNLFVFYIRDWETIDQLVISKPMMVRLWYFYNP
jgi:hypothetical protein